MTIRKYQPADCPAMARMFRDTVLTVCAKDYLPDQLRVWAGGAGDLDRWNRIFSGSYALVAEWDGEVAGFGNMDAAGHLDFLYVHRDFQGRGVASAICDRLERHFPGQTYTTHASITARPFFERRGYVIIREQRVERQGVWLKNYVMQKPGQ